MTVPQPKHLKLKVINYNADVRQSYIVTSLKMIRPELKCIWLFLIGLCVHTALALYEDQAGKFDWKLPFIGKAKFAHIIDAKRIAVATEENVIAVLNTKTSQIIWRQTLESPADQQIKFLHVNKDVVTVSGTSNSCYIRGWDFNTGTILWEWMLHNEDNIQPRWIVDGGYLVQIAFYIRSHIEVMKYNIQTGQHVEKVVRISAPWIQDSSNCIFAHSYLVCISSKDNDGQIYYLKLSESLYKVHSYPLNSLYDETSGHVQIQSYIHYKPAFLLVTHRDAKLLIIEDEVVKVLMPSISPNSIVLPSNSGKSKLVQLEINPDDPEKLLRVVTQEIETRIDRTFVDVQYPLGLGAPYIVAGGGKGDSFDLLLSSSDNALTLLRLPEGKILWTREEALSHIIAVEFLELPVSDLDASIEKEFKSTGDMLDMFCQRILSQMKQLSSVLFGNQLLTTKNGLVRDEFGLHKLIVVATSVGKLFAIDTFTGNIVWSYRLPYVVPYTTLGKQNMLLFVQRTARYAPLPAQCVLLAKDFHTGNGVLFRFDPISGYSETGIQRLNYSIKQAVLLPHEDENHVKAVLVLSEDNQIYVYPTSGEHIVYENAQTTYLYSVNSETGSLHGYNFLHSTEDKLSLNHVWNLHLGASKLSAFGVHLPYERVHSQGRVLPDRSVYYKYINPNMLALATVSEDAVHKHVVSVYLIDGVTGLVLFSACHKKAKGPIHLVHSENWIVYSYFNERFRRTEVASVEFYEGRIQSNSSVFSSHAVSQLPHAESQAYILPATPHFIATTITERGITSKFILIALTNGVIAEVPWAFIQPRLPDVACGPEESCIPYIPEIPLHPEASVNYNQTLERVRGIHTGPARLESTSHVLVHGLDVFYTRVAPSKTFDVLKEDFDYKLIILVLSGLVIASYVTKKLASRKALRQAWK